MRLTESEWLLMNALWECHPATARELREHLPEGVTWAHTTVKTMLTRLKDKQAVSERKRGNTSVYEPLVTQKRARLHALSLLINQAFAGGLEPFFSFLVQERKLSKRQRERLLRILQEEQFKDGGKDDAHD